MKNETLFSDLFCNLLPDRATDDFCKGIVLASVNVLMSSGATFDKAIQTVVKALPEKYSLNMAHFPVSFWNDVVDYYSALHLYRESGASEHDANQPGKFEGEPAYTLYFWNYYLNGGSDDEMEGDTLVSRFKVTKADKWLFPELRLGQVIRLYESNDGFVCRM